MQPKTKIALSDKELSLASNGEIIFTKQAIMQKASEMLGGCVPYIKKIFFDNNILAGEEISSSVPKITKGENYLQLPYVILDYPRYFKDQNVFAIRTMFWWANFFSITLHLSGSYKAAFCKALCENSKRIQQYNFFICINEKQWQHHFGADNYLPAAFMNEKEMRAIFEEKKFIKIALQFPLENWNNMPENLRKGFKKISDVLK